MMNQFGLIIQETTAGSGQQFVSDHLDVNNPEIKETITDERFIATQLANLTDVYSVQITKSYKVYSLIVTDFTDFLGRSGYYAIRLYGPKGVNLTNFENILASIKEKYNSYTKSNTLNNQNYDAILSSILIIENERKNFISLKSDVNCYYYFEETNTTLSTVFNTKGINLVHKVYAFNKEKALAENSANSLGLIPYISINSSQKEINVINNYSILKELKINNQTIDFNPNVSDFNLLCRSSDSVVYNTTDDKNFRQIDNTFITIERKYVPRPTEQRQYPKGGKKTFWEENGIYLVIFLLTIMIAGGIWWVLEGEKKENDVENSEGIIVEIPIDSTSVNNLTFKKDSLEENVFRSSYPKKLENYSFKFDNEKWKYRKNNETYHRFYIEDIKKIIDNNDLKVTEEDFKNKLELISGGNKITNKKDELLNQNDDSPSRNKSSKPTIPNSKNKGTIPSTKPNHNNQEPTIDI